MINYKSIAIFVLFVIILIPLTVKANIMCNDGTTSPSCSDCHQGCCSHHGGCLNNNSNYNKEKKDTLNDSNIKTLLLIAGTAGGTGIVYGYSKGKKSRKE